MRNLAVVGVIAIYWLLHQDVWNWRKAEPFAFGFLPAGLWYHALYTVGISLLMWLVIRLAWPVELERQAEASPAERKRD